MKFQNPFKRIKTSPHLLLALVVFSAAIAINGYFEARSILNSTSSTAAIGFIYLPLVALIVSLPWLGVGLSLDFVQKALIAAMKDSGLHEKMWSDPPIMGGNRKGLAVMRLVARHANVTPYTLTALSKSLIAYVKSDVAGNKRTPVAVLERLYESNKHSGDFYLIEWGLSHNPATLVAILEALAKSDNEWTRYYLKRNPSTPEHIKGRL